MGGAHVMYARVRRGCGEGRVYVRALGIWGEEGMLRIGSGREGGVEGCDGL